MANSPSKIRDGQMAKVVIAWTLVGIPLAWGIYKTLQGAMKLFQ
jgi:hypothetical protein